MFAKRKAAPEPDLVESEFEAARREWNSYNADLAELRATVDGIRLARSMTGNPRDADDVPDHIRAKAEPFMRQARKRPEQLDALEADTLEKIEALQKDGDAKTLAWERAKRREADRIAVELQGRHRAAVADMAAAVEKLSAAIRAEAEIHDEFRRAAPLPESAFLPNFGADLLIGTVSDFHSPANRFAKRVRAVGILD